MKTIQHYERKKEVGFANLHSDDVINQTVMMEFIKADLQRYFIIVGKCLNPPIVMKLRIILENYGFHASLVYRIGRWIESNKSFRKLFIIRHLLHGAYSVLNFLVIKMYDIKIDRKAIIGKGLYIGHFANINISMCIMGENCSVHQSVHIEDGGSGSTEQICHIGNNVWIGPHAIIKEGIKIGDGATISAGSVVLSDIESKCLAIGNPARILKKNFNNSELLRERPLEDKNNCS